MYTCFFESEALAPLAFAPPAAESVPKQGRAKLKINREAAIYAENLFISEKLISGVNFLWSVQ